MSEWRNKTIAKIADIRVSNVDKKIHQGKTLVKLCNYMDVYSNYYIKNDIPFQVGSADTNELHRFTLNFDDVIITKDSETPDDIAVPAIISEHIDNLVCGYHLAILRPNRGELDGHFFMHKLQLPDVKNYFFQVANGSTRYGLTISDIENVKINIPASISEQRKIARILSTVDEVIEKTEAAIAKYKAVKAGMMRDLFTRGIDLVTGKLRPPYEETPHLYKQTELGWVPKEWEVVRVEQFASQEKNAIVDGPFGSNLKTIHYMSEGIPIIQSGFVTNNEFYAEEYLYVSKDKFLSEIRSKVSPGDIVMAKIGAQCGTSAILPKIHPISILAGNCLKITVAKNNSNIFFEHYLHYLYDTQMIFLIISTTAQPAVSMSSFKVMSVIRPSCDEQVAIAKRINDVAITGKSEISLLNKYQQLKQALMSDLLTGKVPVKYEEEKKEAV